MIFLFKYGITLDVFKVDGKVPVEKDILTIADIGSLSGVLKSFKNLRGMLPGPINLLFLAWFFDRELPQH